MNGNEATVSFFSKSIVTDFSIMSCSFSSLKLIFSVCSPFLHSLQFLQPRHLYSILDPA